MYVYFIYEKEMLDDMFFLRMEKLFENMKCIYVLSF